MIHPAVKVLLAAWLFLWLPLHVVFYPLTTFLWLCAYGNVLVVIGVCCESRLIVSWQAVALLVPQLLYAANAALHGRATAYLFNHAIPFAVRALSLFHFVMPLLLLFAVARLGYDTRALPLQLATAVVLFAVCLPVGPINVWTSSFARQHVAVTLLLAPLVLHVPAHVMLRRWA
jgi:hypothetical protein